MTFSSCLTDLDKVIVLDASVVINLLATGSARAILQTLEASFFVTANVVNEIQKGGTNGRQEPKLLTELIDAGIVRVEELSGSSLERFFDVVSGHTVDSLGDGEAATLAFAYSHGFTAAIDEKKATRVAGMRFEAMRIITTIDIFASAPVQALLGREALAGAILRALQVARMQVRQYQYSWVVGLVGAGNITACPSLKRFSRC